MLDHVYEKNERGQNTKLNAYGEIMATLQAVILNTNGQHNSDIVILTFPFSSFIMCSSCSLSQASTSDVSKKYCWAWYIASSTSCLLSVSVQSTAHSWASWLWPALTQSASGLRMEAMIAALSNTSSILPLWPCSSLWRVWRRLGQQRQDRSCFRVHSLILLEHIALLSFFLMY